MENYKEDIGRVREAFSLLGGLSKFYLKDGNIDESFDMTVRKLAEFYVADLACVYLPDGKNGTLIAKSCVGMKAGGGIPLSKRSPEAAAFSEKKTVVFPAGADIGLSEHMKGLGIKSGLWAPLVADGSYAIGVLGIGFRAAKQIPAAEASYLEAIANDLAVYVKKEEALRGLTESKDFLSSILEGIGEGVVVVDRDFRITEANRGYCEQVKLGCDEIIGRHCYEVSHHNAKPCYEMGEACAVKQTFEQGKSIKTVHTHYDKNGTTEHIENIGYPLFDSSGRIKYVVEVLTDVSRRVELEQEREKRVKELEEFYEMAVEREIRMKELKAEIEKLRARGGHEA